MSITYLIIVQR